MSVLSVPSIFESFNARALDPEQVAKTFVPSRPFDDLVKRRHSLIMGPRGSGKTTLLKMLQQPALEAWQHDFADHYRSRIDFTGIFVPTDLAWGEQIESLGANLDPPTKRLLSVATFTTHILKCLITAIMRRSNSVVEKSGKGFRRINLSVEAEASIASALCRNWHIQASIPSFLSIRQSLSERLLYLYEVASREATLGEKDRAQRLADARYLHLHFLTAAGLAVELLDDCLETRTGKWAFLFDELELAPPWIQEELAKSLRSTDDRFLFKLALNPFTPNDALLQVKPTAPASGQDFDQIALWYVDRRGAFEFCRALWDQMLQARNIRPRKPETILGESYFQTSSEERGGKRSAYGGDSKLTRRFRDLAAKDQSFKRYLETYHVNLDEIDRMPESKRAAKVRKVAPIVTIREFYRRPEVKDLEVGRERSRKTAKLYSGAESLFSITEGNPRWFIAIVDNLLQKWDVEREKKIDPYVQAEEIIAAAERFQAMLETMPVAEGSSPTEPLGVLFVVSKAAEYFHHHIVKEPFRPDVPETFTADQKVSREILSVLGRAVNAGAIVFVPEKEKLLIATEEELIGKRFRISYLLAPIYGLSLRLRKGVALSTILSKKLPKPGDGSSQDKQFQLY